MSLQSLEHSIDCKENYLGHEMPMSSVVLLTSLLQKLPLNKASGPHCISAEHLLYAGESLCFLLSELFNMCIVHGYVPNSCLNTTIVPICKNKNGNMQNRRQKVFNRGVLQFCGGLDIIKLTKTPLIYSVSRFNLGGLGALFGGAKPTKAPCGDGTGNMSDSSNYRPVAVTTVLLKLLEHFILSSTLFLRMGGIAPLGAILMGKGAKKTNGVIGG